MEKIKDLIQELFNSETWVYWVIGIGFILLLVLPKVHIENTVELTYMNGDKDTIVYEEVLYPILVDGCYYKESYRDSTRVRQPWGEPFACGVRSYQILKRTELQ